MMHRLLWLLLICLPVAAWAEWRFVGGALRADYYIELSSVRSNGSNREVLELFDLSEPDAHGSRSYLAVFEYDCWARQYRILRSACFDGQMARGQQGRENRIPGAWQEVLPSSAGNTVLDQVCNQ